MTLMIFFCMLDYTWNHFPINTAPGIAEFGGIDGFRPKKKKKRQLNPQQSVKEFRTRHSSYLIKHTADLSLALMSLRDGNHINICPPRQPTFGRTETQQEKKRKKKKKSKSYKWTVWTLLASVIEGLNPDRVWCEREKTSVRVRQVQDSDSWLSLFIYHGVIVHGLWLVAHLASLFPPLSPRSVSLVFCFFVFTGSVQPCFRCRQTCQTVALRNQTESDALWHRKRGSSKLPRHLVTLHGAEWCFTLE